MEELFLQEYQPLVFAQLKKSVEHGRPMLIFLKAMQERANMR